MTRVEPNRLRLRANVSSSLREALRELPNPEPSSAQLEALRVRLGLGPNGLGARATGQALPSTKRRMAARRLGRTIAGLVLFPVAAVAAVGGLVEAGRRVSSAVISAPSSTVATAVAGPVHPPHTQVSAGVPITPSIPSADGARAAATPPALSQVAMRAANPAAPEPEGPPAPTAAVASVAAKAIATFDPLPVSSTPLTTEIALLQAANAALVKGNPATALQLVERHRQAFAAGNLAQEREVIAIKALLAQGKIAQARDGVASFDRAYPHSAHVLELRQIVR